MINTEVRRSQVYIGTGSVSNYTFPFRVFGTDQIRVLVRPKDGEAAELSRSAFSVALASSYQQSTGGTITLNDPLAEGSRLVILSAIPFTQLLALQNQGAFSPEDLNRAWDKNCALIQQVKDLLDRAVLTPELGDETPEEFTASLFEARDEAVASAGAAAQSAASADQSAQTAEHYAEAAKEGAEQVTPYAEEIVTVANNISYVRTDAQNIDAIRGTAEHVNAVAIVAADFKSALAHPNLHNFGYFNVDDVPEYTPKGGFIEIVANYIGDVSAVGGSIEAVRTDAENIEAIKTVAGKITEVSAVGGSIESVEEVAANMDVVKAAKANADTAQRAADAASTSASSAATSEANAKTSETNAKGSESNAAKSATAAKTSETNAASSKAAAAASATAAGTSATNAKSSETASAASAKTASDAAASATDSKDAAASSATSAGTAKTAAESAATRAEAAAEQATSGQVQADWNETDTTAKSFIKGKPTVFPPAGHTHTVVQITDFPTTWAWNAISGKPSSFTPSAHTHAITDVTGLQTALDAKATTAALTEGLAGKAPTSHTHTVSQITDFPKTWAWSAITGKPTLGTMAAMDVDFGTWSAS